MLATQRFNRFNLTFGIGYNSNRDVPDSYLYFSYPFLLPVPGYNVTATGLPDAERDRNLETLQFIAKETVARGIQFNLALWSHAYRWPQRRDPCRIAGLTPGKHTRPIAADGLIAILQAVPEVTRTEPARSQRKRRFPPAATTSGRPCFPPSTKPGGRSMSMSMPRAPTNSTSRLRVRRECRMSMAPKFWAEHMGMPYHRHPRP